MWWYKFLLVLGVLTFRMKLIEARIVWKMKEGNTSTKEVGVACRTEGYRENGPVLK